MLYADHAVVRPPPATQLEVHAALHVHKDDAARKPNSKHLRESCKSTSYLSTTKPSKG